MPGSRVFQLKVTLKGSKPPIWRRIQVPGDVYLDDLHIVLQIAMGWWNNHLHGFYVDGRAYGELDPELPGDMDEESEVRLDQVAAPGKKILYEYDFGDGWTHVLAVEKVLDPSPRQRYPRCVAGRRACPPEDCGGIPGYYHLLEVLADPAHEERDEVQEWLGEDFDPEAFDLEAVNAELQEPD